MKNKSPSSALNLPGAIINYKCILGSLSSLRATLSTMVSNLKGDRIQFEHMNIPINK